MKLAFCLFNYFPYGGLQKDFYQIAKSCARLNHDIHVYTMKWEGDKPDFCHIHEIANWRLQNHDRAVKFAQDIQNLIQDYDIRIGFNKMPGLDIYYAADNCLKATLAQKKYPWFYQKLPRYKHYLHLEETIFNVNSTTKVVYIAQKNLKNYAAHYKLNPANHLLLPPGIDPSFKNLPLKNIVKYHLREQLGLSQNKLHLIQVASHFKTKGLDRALIAISTLPSTLQKNIQFNVIGKDSPNNYLRLAKNLKIKANIKFHGAQDNIKMWLQSQDLMIHPAYQESAGLILLEAIAANLPILTSDACGYADYVKEAKAGIVVEEPFRQAALNQQLLNLLQRVECLDDYSLNAKKFAENADFYSLTTAFTSLIEEVGSR